MKLRYVILFSLLSIFLFGRMSYSEIFQYYDSDGNPLSSGASKRQAGLSYEVWKYYVPEGIELQKDIRYEFFPVFGRTFSEIVRSAVDNSSVGPKDKKRLPSRVDWISGWSYRLAYAHGVDEQLKSVHASVEIYDINIIYDITITLPALIDDTVLNPAEKALWKSYYLRLLEYEYDHARIIRDRDAQEELRKKFSDMNYVIFDYSPDIDIQKTVETFIRKETDKMGREWAKSLKKRVNEYDRATEYGLDLEKRDAFFSRKEK